MSDMFVNYVVMASDGSGNPTGFPVYSGSEEGANAEIASKTGFLVLRADDPLVAASIAAAEAM